MSAKSYDSEQPTTPWKIRNSLWVFMCAGTFGLAAPWIILYVAVASRRPAWMAFGAMLGAASITSMVWVSGAAIWQREAADWLLMAVWLGGSTFAAGVNREYLRIKWAARKDVDAAFPTAASKPARRTRGGAARTTSAASTPSGTRKRGSDQEGDRPEMAARKRGPRQPGSSTPIPAHNASWSAPAHSRAPLAAGASSEMDTVEINGASAEEFAALPGFDPGLAARAVSLRQGRPYMSIEQFAERLALQPHVFVRIRDRLSCRYASVPPGFGRRVDY